MNPLKAGPGSHGRTDAKPSVGADGKHEQDAARLRTPRPVPPPPPPGEAPASLPQRQATVLSAGDSRKRKAEEQHVDPGPEPDASDKKARSARPQVRPDTQDFADRVMPLLQAHASSSSSSSSSSAPAASPDPAALRQAIRDWLLDGAGPRGRLKLSRVGAATSRLVSLAMELPAGQRDPLVRAFAEAIGEHPDAWASIGAKLIAQKNSLATERACAAIVQVFGDTAGPGFFLQPVGHRSLAHRLIHGTVGLGHCDAMRVSMVRSLAAVDDGEHLLALIPSLTTCQSDTPVVAFCRAVGKACGRQMPAPLLRDVVHAIIADADETAFVASHAIPTLLGALAEPDLDPAHHEALSDLWLAPDGPLTLARRTSLLGVHLFRAPDAVDRFRPLLAQLLERHPVLDATVGQALGWGLGGVLQMHGQTFLGGSFPQLEPGGLTPLLGELIAACVPRLRTDAGRQASEEALVAMVRALFRWVPRHITRETSLTADTIAASLPWHAAWFAACLRAELTPDQARLLASAALHPDTVWQGDDVTFMHLAKAIRLTPRPVPGPQAPARIEALVQGGAQAILRLWVASGALQEPLTMGGSAMRVADALIVLMDGLSRPVTAVDHTPLERDCLRAAGRGLGRALRAEAPMLLDAVLVSLMETQLAGVLGPHRPPQVLGLAEGMSASAPLDDVQARLLVGRLSLPPGTVAVGDQAALRDGMRELLGPERVDRLGHSIRRRAYMPDVRLARRLTAGPAPQDEAPVAGGSAEAGPVRRIADLCKAIEALGPAPILRAPDMPGVPAFLPTLLHPRYQKAASLWLRVGNEARELAIDTPEHLALRTQLIQAQEQLHPYMQPTAVPADDAGWTQAFSRFERLSRPDYTEAQWRRDAVLFAWSTGLSTAPAPVQQRLMTARSRHLRNHLAPDIGVEMSARHADPILAGLMQAAARPPGLLEADAPHVATLLSAAVAGVLSDTEQPQPTPHEQDAARLFRSAKALALAVRAARESAPARQLARADWCGLLAPMGEPAADPLIVMIGNELTTMAAIIAFALDADRDPLMRDALADTAIEWESATFRPSVHLSLAEAVGQVAVMREGPGQPMREDRLVAMLQRIFHRPGAVRRQPEFVMGLLDAPTGLQSSRAMTRSRRLLAAVRDLPLAVMTDCLSLVPIPVGTGQAQAPAGTLARTIATLPPTDGDSLQALPDDVAWPTAIALSLALVSQGRSEAFIRREFGPAQAGQPTPRERLCLRAVDVALQAHRLLIDDPALPAPAHLLDAIYALPGYLDGNRAAVQFSAALSEPLLSPSLRLQALGSLLRHGARHLTSGHFSLLRLTMREQIEHLLVPEGEADDADGDAAMPDAKGTVSSSSSSSASSTTTTGPVDAGGLQVSPAQERIVRFTDAAYTLAGAYRYFRHIGAIAFLHEAAEAPLDRIEAQRASIQAHADFLANELRMVRGYPRLLPGLVDPDTHRPIDNKLRAALLEALTGLRKPLTQALARLPAAPHPTTPPTADIEPAARPLDQADDPQER